MTRRVNWVRGLVPITMIMLAIWKTEFIIFLEERREVCEGGVMGLVRWWEGRFVTVSTNTPYLKVVGIFSGI